MSIFELAVQMNKNWVVKEQIVITEDVVQWWALCKDFA